MGRRRKSRTSQTQAQILSREQISISREINYIIGRAQNSDSRFVTLGALILFSTPTGDAWLLHSEDGLALCLARDGTKQPFSVVETPTNFGIDWKANYRIEGDTFIVIDQSGQVKSIVGYPTGEISQASHLAR